MNLRPTLIALAATFLLVATAIAQRPVSPTGEVTHQAAETLEDEFDASDVVATTAWAESLHLADWLGPLAPVALSPFFGVALLSGLSLYGPEWVTDNALLGASGPLQSQALFWIFVGLTLLTSLPRLTKVSKPFAQAVDRLETYAVIVILLIVKVVASAESPPEPGAEVAMVHLGIVSFTVDTLLVFAMIVNVLVINSVKFFFEFMVWLTPIPAVDAIFEICNKSVCAALMAIYAFSPTLATIINLAILLAAATVLRWISRRVRFYRTMILDPILARLWSGFGTPKRPELVVFPTDEIGPFPAKSRLRLCRSDSGDGWELQETGWLGRSGTHRLPADVRPSLQRGWVMHTIRCRSCAEQPEFSLTTSRRYDTSLDRLAESMSIVVADDLPEPDGKMRGLGQALIKP